MRINILDVLCSFEKTRLVVATLTIYSNISVIGKLVSCTLGYIGHWFISGIHAFIYKKVSCVSSNILS